MNQIGLCLVLADFVGLCQVSPESGSFEASALMARVVLVLSGLSVFVLVLLGCGGSRRLRHALLIRFHQIPSCWARFRQIGLRRVLSDFVSTESVFDS